MDRQEELFSGEAPVDSQAGPRSRSEAEGGRPMPLAARLRPRRLEEVVGQDHLLEAGALLPKLVAGNAFGSLLFYGPPGSGKTSLAEAIANETESRFVRVNAVNSNVAELRGHLEMARRMPDRDTILFIDEIHRFNKSQQDLLLPDIEAGSVRLIGATTHNPGFYVNAPLLSRSHLFRLEPHGVESVVGALRRALADEERGLGSRRHEAAAGALEAIARFSDGDLRRALNALEVIALSLNEGQPIEAESVAAFARERQIRYDADEDEHYDTISAFIKSLRGGDPDAALYWLAKMLAGGEDPRFVARRLVIFSSEDVALADAQALPLAVATQQACSFVGLPECEINLAHCVVYLALAPKSNTAYEALGRAKRALAERPVQPVPVWLRDSGGAASKRMGHAADYRYSHGYPENISGQDYLVEPLSLYEPRRSGQETAMAERLERWRRIKARIQNEERGSEA